VEEELEGISPSPLFKPGESGVLPKIDKPVESPPLRLEKNQNFESSGGKGNPPSPKPILKQSKLDSEEKKTEKQFGITLKPLNKSEEDSLTSEEEDPKSAKPSSKACEVCPPRKRKQKSAIKSCRSTKTMKSFKCYASDRDERESFYKLSVKPN